MERTTPILITGAAGFVGRNLVDTLTRLGYTDLMCFDRSDSPEALTVFCRRAGFVVHLAGVNRPQDPSEFYTGNAGLTDTLLAQLEAAGSHAPVLVTSSVQAELDNDYGKSKRAAEQAVYAHGDKLGSPVYVFRMEGVFGKWCRPNYNSVVATFCHNIARGLPIQVRDPAFSLPLVYIDDVVQCILDAFDGAVLCDRSRHPICHIHPVHEITLGRLAETLQSFAAGAPAPSDPDSLEAKLWHTYRSYLPATSASV